MLYILVTAIVFCALLCAAEPLARLADRTGIMDRLFKLFDLPKEDAESNVIYLDFQKAHKERNA